MRREPHRESPTFMCGEEVNSRNALRKAPAATAPPAAPFSAAGPEALLRLGLDVNAPLASVRPAFERLLPAAAPCGYFAALREAFGRGEARPGDDADQLRWLADHLRLSAPCESDVSVSWARAWGEAASARAEPPSELGPRARRVLLDELLSRPRYGSQLADALTVALRVRGEPGGA